MIKAFVIVVLKDFLLTAANVSSQVREDVSVADTEDTCTLDGQNSIMNASNAFSTKVPE